MQTTLESSIIFSGVGLHSGKSVSLSIKPASENHGILFKRKDIEIGNPIVRARWDYVSKTTLCTRVTNEDGTFDFAQYRYFSFPLPFVVNFANGEGMMTVEIAIATYETTLRGERLIEKLTTFAPKMRSAINLVLACLLYTSPSPRDS